MNPIQFAKEIGPVFPVSAKKKTPLIEDWENRATRNPDLIEEWMIDFPNCNFGFAAGKADVVVIDCDVKKEVRQPDGSIRVIDGEDSLLEFLNGRELPRTFTVRTPSGGTHRYFRAAGLRSKNRFLPGVDVKTNGGYVVIPGSSTEKGLYVVESASPIASMPSWFIEEYGRWKAPETDAEKRGLLTNSGITPDTPEKIDDVKLLMQNWPPAMEGDRNNQLFQLARECCKRGVTKEKFLELYPEHAENVIQLDSLEDEKEIRATVASAYEDMADFGSESAEARSHIARLFPDAGEEEVSFTDDGPVDGAEAMKVEVPDRQWFIDGWLSADKGFSVLYSGRGGSGKSASILDLIASLSTGCDWFGFPVKRGAKCMYVSCEDTQEELFRRWQMRRDKAGSVKEGLVALWSRFSKISLLCEADRNGNLKRAPFFDELKARARKFFRTEGGVLILDTVSDIFGGNENDRGQVSRFVKGFLGNIASDLGVTLVVVGHPSKNAAAGSAYSGSTAWEGAFRCRWELNYQKSDKTDGLLELVMAKGNYRKSGLKITLANQDGRLYRVDSGTAEIVLKDEIVQMIDTAYQEGCPFGRAKNSARPIGNAHIKDPFSGEEMTEKEILQVVAELLSERRIENFKEERSSGLRKV